jgi:hypothetical protein
MADLIAKLKSKPHALKAFLNLPEDKQIEFMSAAGLDTKSRSEQRQALKDLIPGFGNKPVKDQMAYMDQIRPMSKEEVSNEPVEEEKASGGNATPISGPITDTLVGGAFMSGGPAKAATEAAGEAVGSFGSRVANALKNTPKTAGQAVGQAEVTAAQAPVGALSTAASTAERTAALQTPGEQSEVQAALEGVKKSLPLPAEPEDPIQFANQLQKDLVTNGSNLPVQKLADYDKQINMLMQDKSLKGVVRGRIGEYADVVKKLLNAKTAGRAEASQGYADVLKKQQLYEMLKKGGKVIGGGVLAGLGIKEGMKLGQ